MPAPADSIAPPPASLDDEYRVAWRLVVVVLAVITASKYLGHLAWIGTVGFTVAAGVQLYLPLWRAERLGRDLDFVGLHVGAWRKDLTLVGLLVLVTFPPFALAHHLYMTAAHGWLVALGLPNLARFVPALHLAPALPSSLGAWAGLAWSGLALFAIQSLGVALPEEAFYRGYLLPIFERRMSAALRVFGVPIGRAAVLVAALFALGHFLGEWNPMRLGPFFPALVFAWMRTASGSILGPVVYHALANVYGAMLFSLYR